MVFGIGRCGGCGEGGEVAPRVAMVDGVERERLREGRRLQTMSGGVGGRRVGRDGRGGNIYCVRVLVGDVLRKKYIMLTKFYYIP